MLNVNDQTVPHKRLLAEAVIIAAILAQKQALTRTQMPV